MTEWRSSALAQTETVGFPYRFAYLWRDELTKDGGPCWICGERDRGYEGSVGYGKTQKEARAMFLRVRRIRDGTPEGTLTAFVTYTATTFGSHEAMR